MAYLFLTAGIMTGVIAVVVGLMTAEIWAMWAGLGLANVFLLVHDLLIPSGHNVPADMAAIIIDVVFAWFFWRRRGKKRSLRAYGAKSRALVTALVGKLREREIRRPVPVPA